MHTVKLKSRHLEELISIMQDVMDYKIQVLKPRNWQTWEEEYLPSLVEQIQKNEFKCNDRLNNTFTWCIDQICHSNSIIPGVEAKQGLPLADTARGQKILPILRAASQGQNFYNSWCNTDHFTNLFT